MSEMYWLIPSNQILCSQINLFLTDSEFIRKKINWKAIDKLWIDILVTDNNLSQQYGARTFTVILSNLDS